MSLQVWLPLNGNLDNQGLSNIKATTSGIPTFTSSGGKLHSSCLNNVNEVSVSVPSMAGARVWSYCFWGFVNSSLITSDWTKIARINDGVDNLRIEICPKGNYSGDTFCYTIHNNPGYVIAKGVIGTPNGTQYYDTWVHFCLTCDGTTITKYLNGQKIGTTPYIGDGAITGVFVLSNNHKIYKQDMRVYDHCLSPKEVKEIAKGLIVHYKLSNPMETSVRNLYNAPYCNGYTTDGTLNTDGSYNVKWSYTGTGSDSWWSMKFPTFNFTAGKTYMWMCKVKVNSCTSNVSLQMRCARIDNDWACPASKWVVSDSLVGKGWIEYYAFATLQMTSDRSGTTYTTAPLLEFYTGSRKTASEVFSMDFDIKDVMICETSTYVPYVNNSMSSSNINDCSGFKNNGEIVGTLTPDSSTPRYEQSYSFNGSSYIKAPSPTAEAKTVSCWVYIGDTLPVSKIIMVDYKSKLALGFSSNSYIVNTCDSNNKKRQRDVVNYIIKNNWNHILTDKNNNLYINGELIPIGSLSTNNWAQTSDELIVGGRYNSSGYNTFWDNKMSDFRLYTTILSEDEVKELYNTAAWVASNAMAAYELKEV